MDVSATYPFISKISAIIHIALDWFTPTPEIPLSRPQQAAFNEGSAAYREGKSPDSNHYPMCDLREQWLAGFNNERVKDDSFLRWLDNRI